MNPIITPFAGLAGLVIAFLILATILKRSGGDGKVKEIADQIHKGAMVFMRREFLLISFFAILIAVLLFFFQKDEYGKDQSLAFVFGCLASSFAGFVGMFTATKSNVRT
ncbi:MAG: sodium/proton-translocating pyrophosphatase, partial [Akkermansiaceae bacterium]